MSSADFVNTLLTQNLNNTSISVAQTSQPSHLAHTQHVFNHQGTTSISLTDDLVKEYLLYRGFTTTFRVFDHDLKIDRDRSFRVDKIIEQLLVYIHAFDLTSFMDYWSYLDQRFFAKFTIKLGGSSSSAAVTKRYEVNLMRYYLIHAVKSSRPEKALEFIENYLVKLQPQSEWKEWFCLPFLKNAEDHPFFSVYFSQSWIDALVVSFQNFLNILFQSLPFPRLLNYDESIFWLKQNKIKRAESNFANFERDYLQADLVDEFQPAESQNDKVINTNLSFTSVVKSLNKAFKPKI